MPSRPRSFTSGAFLCPGISSPWARPLLSAPLPVLRLLQQSIWVLSLSLPLLPSRHSCPCSPRAQLPPAPLAPAAPAPLLAPLAPSSPAPIAPLRKPAPLAPIAPAPLKPIAPAPLAPAASAPIAPAPSAPIAPAGYNPTLQQLQQTLAPTVVSPSIVPKANALTKTVHASSTAPMMVLNLQELMKQGTTSGTSPHLPFIVIVPKDFALQNPAPKVAPKVALKAAPKVASPAVRPQRSVTPSVYRTDARLPTVLQQILAATNQAVPQRPERSYVFTALSQ
ncbi:hypothetical protein C7M84_024189 [Penaeus vannamei]|uniref:Uncharacterized protein n=1 Tax=Penaeus vannamei TaxID=6689 RepID=A0A423U1R5_PENVA|nr:hypothetical protein C7M84_024189 [Penaeus vannamei]